MNIKMLAFLGLASMAAAAGAVPETNDSAKSFPRFYDQIEVLADMILESQIEEGGIGNYVIKEGQSSPVFMTTYTFGPLGLLKAYQMSGKEEYLEAAKKFVDFWFERQNVRPDRWGIVGTFYDQSKENGVITDHIYTKERSLSNAGGPGYDASDSDGPMVSLTAYNYYLLTGDIEILQNYADGCKLIGDSIIATYDFRDSLTYCHPNYKVKYLMDVCEVYHQIKALAGIFEVLDSVIKERVSDGNFASYKVWNYHFLSENYKQIAQDMKESILSLWNEQEKWYYWAKDVKGKKQHCRWDRMYPDTQEQIWPMLWYVTSPDMKQSKEVWENLNQNHPKWHETDLEWPSTSTVAIKMQDFEKAETHISRILSEMKPNPAWETNDKHLMIHNCCFDFDIEGCCRMVKGSLAVKDNECRFQITAAIDGSAKIKVRKSVVDDARIMVNSKPAKIKEYAGYYIYEFDAKKSDIKDISFKIAKD
ncbi:hypothetical protein SMSP2_02657 [Limihaloglobus sulfuriphilus]|uniref:Uncharacterized protein n=1 Tax=Limihaloglobus sulfuriphilus TaxID=1851148 RepID=A0A1Q2MHT9_9BACT|nr:hypothetical protein [Limihaloglobus sulfuriphilus]AQQ72275.1 hypothetical protein SMSP2_02657 [Limihaloglobus sulfuriphilus]